jgi:hypothetical protein
MPSKFLVVRWRLPGGGPGGCTYWLSDSHHSRVLFLHVRVIASVLPIHQGPRLLKPFFFLSWCSAEVKLAGPDVDWDADYKIRTASLKELDIDQDLETRGPYPYIEQVSVGSPEAFFSSHNTQASLPGSHYAFGVPWVRLCSEYTLVRTLVLCVGNEPRDVIVHVQCLNRIPCPCSGCPLPGLDV